MMITMVDPTTSLRESHVTFCSSAYASLKKTEICSNIPSLIMAPTLSFVRREFLSLKESPR